MAKENKILNKKIIPYKENKEIIFMPNEIFDDLLGIECFKKIDRRAFTYTYYYILLYLYRYAKYGTIYITTKEVKELLGYSSIDKRLDAIIKKDGILDSLNYTETSVDFPIAWSPEPYFYMFSEQDDTIKSAIRNTIGNNYKIKVPKKGFYRSIESEKEAIEDGVFFNIENTHKINIDIFVKCMGNEKLMCKGFYIYQYLNYKSYGKESVQISVDSICDKLQCGRNLVFNTLAELEERNIIKVEQTVTKYDKKSSRFYQSPHIYHLLTV